MIIAELRRDYHRRVAEEIIRLSGGSTTRPYPNFADSSSIASIQFAWGIVKRLGHPVADERIKGQTAGGRFEVCTRDFLQHAFSLLGHLRPGPWMYETHRRIDGFEQYEHLASLQKIIDRNRDLASSLRSDYIVMPDIVVARTPLPLEQINRHQELLNENDDTIAAYTPLIERHPDARAGNSLPPILLQAFLANGLFAVTEARTPALKHSISFGTEKDIHHTSL